MGFELSLLLESSGRSDMCRDEVVCEEGVAAALDDSGVPLGCWTKPSTPSWSTVNAAAATDIQRDRDFTIVIFNS